MRHVGDITGNLSEISVEDLVSLFKSSMISTNSKMSILIELKKRVNYLNKKAEELKHESEAMLAEVKKLEIKYGK